MFLVKGLVIQVFGLLLMLTVLHGKGYIGDVYLP